MWPVILGGALLAGGTTSTMIGNRQATRAGRSVVRAESGRQRQLDRELEARTDDLLRASSPTRELGAKLAAGSTDAAELARLGSDIQAGAQTAGLPALTPGRSTRIQSAARALARSRASARTTAAKDLRLGQFVLDRNRIQQRSRNSQAIAGVEAEDAAQKGGNWRQAGGLMQSAGMLSMLAAG